MIKTSSPNINNLIIIGCIMCYAILYGMDLKYLPQVAIGRMCNVNTVLLSVGFTLSFGRLFSKTWRVYRIYSGAMKNKKVVLRDYHLYCIIFFILSIDVLVLVLFLVISPFELQEWIVKEQLDLKKDIRHIFIRHHCNCKNRVALVSTLFSYKALLLVFGLFMAWETRNVDMSSLNDSKQIGISVYTVSVVAAVGTICAWALNMNVNRMEENYFIVALSIWLCTTITLLLVFVPKINFLFNKDGNRRKQSVASYSSVSNAYQPVFNTKIVMERENECTLLHLCTKFFKSTYVSAC